GRLARRDVDRRPHLGRPAPVVGGVAHEGRRAPEMTAERDVAMVAVDAEVVDVGERIVLRLEAIATDLLHELLDVRRNGLEAERAEDLAVEVAHLGADADAAAVVGTADGPLAEAGGRAIVDRRGLLIPTESDIQFHRLPLPSDTR